MMKNVKKISSTLNLEYNKKYLGCDKRNHDGGYRNVQYDEMRRYCWETKQVYVSKHNDYGGHEQQ